MHGLMEGSMLAGGTKQSNMAMESTLTSRVLQGMDFMKMENVYRGWMPMMSN